MLDRIDSYRWLIVATLAIPVVAGSALLFFERKLTALQVIDVNENADIVASGADGSLFLFEHRGK